MEVIATTNAPKALGPYSQAVLAGSILFVSGQIAINPETGEMVQSSIEAETQQVLDNIEAILTEARFRFMDVVKTTIFVDDIRILMLLMLFMQKPLRLSRRHAPLYR